MPQKPLFTVMNELTKPQHLSEKETSRSRGGTVFWRVLWGRTSPQEWKQKAERAFASRTGEVVNFLTLSGRADNVGRWGGKRFLCDNIIARRLCKATLNFLPTSATKQGAKQQSPIGMSFRLKAIKANFPLHLVIFFASCVTRKWARCSFACLNPVIVLTCVEDGWSARVSRFFSFWTKYTLEEKSHIYARLCS